MSAEAATTAAASGQGTRRGWSGINSFFLVNAAGKVIVEKHWRGGTDRAALDTWFRERLRGGGPAGGQQQQHAEPVLRAADGSRALLHVCRSGMFYLCVVGGEGEKTTDDKTCGAGSGPATELTAEISSSTAAVRTRVPAQHCRHPVRLFRRHQRGYHKRTLCHGVPAPRGDDGRRVPDHNRTQLTQGVHTAAEHAQRCHQHRRRGHEREPSNTERELLKLRRPMAAGGREALEQRDISRHCGEARRDPGCVSWRTAPVR
ncbi:MAG: hypothetical protein BJ554DRAFT_6844 [Olpidium bornovanus]|uniref:Uncharacterized protein n=1 Tax=Olpidium bornovanus TaxID=278681 RepID=A0A8H8DKF0_9FUNG|nr:MAG: hypothetical protein BJ554DRAFT_6844 [Olpidium bornovanus]